MEYHLFFRKEYAEGFYLSASPKRLTCAQSETALGHF